MYLFFMEEIYILIVWIVYTNIKYIVLIQVQDLHGRESNRD